MQKLHTAKPELLAPCGSLEAFFAAMESGADAVYAGLREFSARARAKNFTMGQITKMLSYAHQRNRKIYITLNTLVKENELAPLVETLAELARIRADGVIVQDMAVARLIRNHFPSIPLHASTQMTIHNLPGVKLLEELGFERVVLARELQLADIADIAAKTSAELEIFVHGALCFSVSGQCHFSSLLGGHSGNRGRCAQPCRRLYSHRNKDGYYFSPNDLSALELVPELAAAGVKSLKIEGRMKSADYVAKVVAAYRLVLDAPRLDLKAATSQAKQILKDSFGRTPTKGFLSSSDPADIANPWLRGGTGRFVGEVKKSLNGRLLFETRDPLHAGDRLRLQPKSDMAGQAWTMREMYVGRKKVMECLAGTQLEVVCPFESKPGDALFKVGAADAFGMSDEAATRKLQAAGPDRLRVKLLLSFENETMHIRATIAGESLDYQFVLGPLEPARNSGMEEVFRSRFNETGDTPFTLDSLEAPGFPPLYIPPARLKDIRRELYRALGNDIHASLRKGLEAAKASALEDIEQTATRNRSKPEREELIVVVEGPGDVRWALSHGASEVIVPLQRAAIHTLPRFLGRLRDDADRVRWQLPFMLFDKDIPFVVEGLKAIFDSGFRNFEITNPGHFKLLSKYAGLNLSGGYRLFSLNTQALAAWNELGISRFTSYIEDDSENLSVLISSPFPFSVIAYSPVEVMTTKVKMKEVATGVPLRSDRGEEYTIRGRDGFSLINAATPFSLTGVLANLRKAGCNSFLLDLSDTDAGQRDAIVEAFRQDREIPGTTRFNYERGLL